MANDKRAFTLRMQPKNFEKIKKIAEFNKRSIAMQIKFLVQECITEFENKYGKVFINEDFEVLTKNK